MTVLRCVCSDVWILQPLSVLLWFTLPHCSSSSLVFFFSLWLFLSLSACDFNPFSPCALLPCAGGRLRKRKMKGLSFIPSAAMDNARRDRRIKGGKLDQLEWTESERCAQNKLRGKWREFRKRMIHWQNWNSVLYTYNMRKVLTAMESLAISKILADFQT